MLHVLAIIGVILLGILIGVILAYLDSPTRKLRRLYEINIKLPGLGAYQAFKEYRELFDHAEYGTYKEPMVTKVLGLKINWLIKLSKSSAADIWDSDDTIQEAVINVFTELNESIRDQLIEKRSKQQSKLEQFKRQIIE